MRLTIERSALARLLASTTKVVEARHVIPILATVRLVATADRLTVTATDLDIEIQSSATCVAKPGAVCVDAKLLTAIVAKAGGEEVVIETKDDNITVKCGRFNSKLQTLPAADFPSLDAGKFTTEFEEDLAALFAPVQFAVSVSDANMVLCGIYMHVVDGRLTAAATDRHRLARFVGGAQEEFEGIIVPSKAVGLLPKGLASVSLSATKLRLTTADTVFTTRLIDGTYLPYQRVIPTGNDKVATLDRQAFHGAADRVAVVSSERGGGIKLSLRSGSVGFSVNSNLANADDEVPAEYEGEDLDIGVNGKYLADILHTMPNGPIEMKLADAGSPILFTSAAAPDLILVAMPMRV